MKALSKKKKLTLGQKKQKSSIVGYWDYVFRRYWTLVTYEKESPSDTALFDIWNDHYRLSAAQSLDFSQADRTCYYVCILDEQLKKEYWPSSNRKLKRQFRVELFLSLVALYAQKDQSNLWHFPCCLVIDNNLVTDNDNNHQAEGSLKFLNEHCHTGTLFDDDDNRVKTHLSFKKSEQPKTPGVKTREECPPEWKESPIYVKLEYRSPTNNKMKRVDIHFVDVETYFQKALAMEKREVDVCESQAKKSPQEKTVQLKFKVNVNVHKTINK